MIDHPKIQQLLAAHERELVELHRSLVQIPSVNQGDGLSAREDEVAEFIAGYLEGCGIETRIVESAPHRANLLASFKSNRPGKKSMIMIGHSDVVPEGDAEDWSHPPFGAEIAEGRIWGRGSNDCKMLVAAELFALKKLAEHDLLPGGELRVAIGADEEAGGKFGFGWLAEHESEFLRADLGINEGGGAYLGRSVAEEPIFLIGAGEKGRYEIIFSMKAPGTHASVPWGTVNPLMRISQLAAAVAQWQDVPNGDKPLICSPVFGPLRGWLGLEGPTTAENIGKTIQAARTRYTRSFKNSLMAGSRVTIVPTVISAGGKSNVVPSRAELRCDARLMPGQPTELLSAAVEEIMKDFPDIDSRIEITAESSGSPFDPEIQSLFQRALQETFGDAFDQPVAVGSAWCTGFTDSRFLRQVGTPVYGFQAISPEADADRLGIHCIDESIEVGMLLPCAQSLAHLAVEFLK